jgi:hypothetical protein
MWMKSWYARRMLSTIGSSPALVSIRARAGRIDIHEPSAMRLLISLPLSFYQPPSDVSQT